MQQRRFRPGDVLDDYCPRERRITDHAIVAMIDDRIKQTRCVVCDAEHVYKEGKVPPQRRKRPQAALFTQVLEGLQGPEPAARLAAHADVQPDEDAHGPDGESRVQPPLQVAPAHPSGNGRLPAGGDEGLARSQSETPAAAAAPGDEGSVRRPLIRATLPRSEGQPVATRAMPEFTIRQPTSSRGGHRPGGRHRGAPQQAHGGYGGPRSGRGGGQGQRSPGGGRNQGQGGGRPGGPSRGGKKR
jgi:hypothetical protein